MFSRISSHLSAFPPATDTVDLEPFLSWLNAVNELARLELHPDSVHLELLLAVDKLMLRRVKGGISTRRDENRLGPPTHESSIDAELLELEEWLRWVPRRRRSREVV